MIAYIMMHSTAYCTALRTAQPCAIDVSIGYFYPQSEHAKEYIENTNCLQTITFMLQQ